EDQAATQKITAWFATNDKVMTANNRLQALYPAGAPIVVVSSLFSLIDFFSTLSLFSKSYG
ncbi:hypothetical protein WP50_13115, partial [Lactiplantibacillus plantarum]